MASSRFGFLLRVAAVVFAIVLGGGYILFRAGAGDRILPSSKSGRVRAYPIEQADAAAATTSSTTTQATTAPAITPRPLDKTVIFGSKSAPVALPSDLLPAASQPAAKP